MDVLAEVPDTHTPPSPKQLTVTPLSLMGATAAVPQHLFLYAILRHIPYVLSCLPQPDGELLTPGETRKGEMGNCTLPLEEEVALARKPTGQAASSVWAGVGGAGTQIWPQLEEGRLAAPTADWYWWAIIATLLLAVPALLLHLPRTAEDSPVPPALSWPLFPGAAFALLPEAHQAQPLPTPPQCIPHSPTDRGVSWLGQPLSCITGKGEQQNIMWCEKLLAWEGRQLLCERRKIQREKLQSKVESRCDTEW